MHFHPPARKESSSDLRPDTQALLLSEFVDVNDALRNISTQARVLADATGVAIALAHKNSMICRASVGQAPSLGSRLDATSGFSGECVRTGKALRCDDSETDARVDLASCRRLGIRSMVALPIRAGNGIIGIMEVFSSRPGAFSDWHVSVLRRLVDSPLLNTPALAPWLPDVLLDVEPAKVEPAKKVLASQPLELLRHRETAAANAPSMPAQFWSDVFVPDTLPWNRFAQSLGLHIVMIAALAGFVRFALHGPRVVQLKFNSADVLYYSSSEYFGRKRQRLVAPRLNARPAELPDEQAISVAKEQSRRTEKLVAAPDVRLKGDIRVLPLMAWSSVSPSIPASALMRKQLVTPTAPVTVIAPAPDLSVVGAGGRVARPKPAVIEPPPSVDAGSRHVADISIGALQVVGPPPEISYGEPKAKALATQSNLHDDFAAIIAPSPSLDGIHLPSAGVRGRGASSAGQIVPPPPSISGTRNSRKQSGLRDDLGSVIGPAPSLEGINGSVGRGMGRGAAGAAQVVPPPPQVSGTGYSRGSSQPRAEIAVVSPPPSATDLRRAPGAFVNTRGVASPNIPLAPPPASAPTEAGSSRGELNTSKWNPLPPLDADISDDNGSTERKELSIAPIAPAGALASSSYFASSEIFIAEERLGVHRRRYIKLVYDYLPYQKRLSEYGPNYPQVDKLRATRDLTCDENMTTGAYTISQAEVSRSGGPQAQSQDAVIDQSTLPCFRTTADDYRRALARHPKPHSAH